MTEWLIVESTRESITLLEAGISPAGVEVTACARASLLENFAADPEVLAEQLVTLRGRSTVKQVLLVVPRDVVVLRQFELPSVPDNELPDLVRFQAATKFATPVDELTLDFIPLASRAEGMVRTVIAASIDIALLERWQKACELCGLQLVGCTPSSIALAELVGRELGPSHRERTPTLVIYGDEQRLELLLLDQGCPLFSTNVHVRVEGQSIERLLDRELKRAAVTLNQVEPGAEIAQAVLCGQNTAAAAWLDVVFADRWSLCHPLETSGETLQIRCDTSLISLPALGMALAQSQPHVPGLDFLRPRRRVEQRDWSRWKLIAGVVAAVLVLLVAYGSYLSYLGGLEDDVLALKERQADLQQTLTAGAPVEESARLIEDWEQTRSDPLQFLIQLKESSPETDRLYFRSLKLIPQAGGVQMRVNGSGNARQRSDVEQMYRQLEENGFRVRAKAIDRLNRDPDYPFVFELDADLQRPVASAATPSARS